MKFLLKMIVTICVFLFSITSGYSQTTDDKKEMKKKDYKYGEVSILIINEKADFKDSLTVLLTGFSHKEPYVGGPTKGTAYLTVSRGNMSEEINISVHGRDGHPEIYYDSLNWNEYEFHLKSMDYDHSINVMISKNKVASSD